MATIPLFAFIAIFLIMPWSIVVVEYVMIADATIFARDLSNERADVATPDEFERLARVIAADGNLQMTVLKGSMDDLQTMIENKEAQIHRVQ